MNPSTTTPVLAPQAQAYANQAQSALNDPNLTAAGQNVSSLQQQAGESQAAEQSLPVLLQQSLAGSIGSNDVDVQKAKTDQATFLRDLQDPQSIADTAANGTYMSPLQMRQAVASREGLDAANLSSDNLVMGLRLGGIANIIHSAAAMQASNTQNLLAKLQAAQTTYQQLFDRATKAADLASHLSDVAENTDQFNRQLGQNQQLSPVFQQLKVQAAAHRDAQTMSLEDFYKTYAGNPYLTGDDASAIWNAAHTGQHINFKAMGAANTALGLGDVIKNAINGLKGNPTSGTSGTTRPSLDSIFNK